jgi:uncharacterized membrane protein YeiH
MLHVRAYSLYRRVALIVLSTLVLAAPDAFAQKKAPRTFNVIPITFSSVTVEAGQLVANGNIGSTPFQLPLILTPGATPAGATCPILDLRLGPIDLSLLGLNVATSPICLEITATSGGGLLGDLLCSIANLLNGGSPLADVLAGLTPAQLTLLDQGLTTVLNQVFVPITSSNALVGASCDVLNLAVGPLDLTILGLNVQLDNCSGGPVTVDITATPGGGLLGDLLCNLADVLHTPRPNTTAVLTLLRQIASAIGQLIG